MKKVFIMLLVLLAIGAGLVMALPKVLPYADIRKMVQDKVRDATGREIDFSAARVRFFPDIAVVLDDVTFSNASWAKDKNMLELKQLDLALALQPLLDHRVEVKRFILNAPVIHLEKNTDGKGNWDFSAADKKSPDAAAGAPATSGQKFGFRVGDVKISGGSLTFADRAKNTVESVDGLDLDLSASDLSAPVKLKGEANYRGRRVSLAGGVARPQALLDGKPSAADLALDTEGLSLKVAGDVATEGTLLNGNIDANVPSLSALATWLGSPQKNLPFDKLSFKSAATATGSQIKLTGAALSLDYIDAKGDVSAVYAGRPSVDAHLALGKLDLDKFTPSKGVGNAGTPTAPAAPASQDWDATPIDFSGLKGLDANLVLDTQGFTLKGADVGPSTLTVSLKNGDLHFTSSEATLFGGKFSSDLALNVAGAAPQAAFKFTMAGVQAQPVLTDFAHFKKLSGTADANVSVTSSGDSQKALVSALGGSGAVTFKNGELQGLDLVKIARLIQSHFAGMNAGDGSTRFVEMGGTFKIAGGVAANDDFKLQGPLVQATGQGQIDLPRKYIQYRMLPVLTLSSGAKAPGLSVPVEIKGPFSDVKVVPDYGSALQSALKSPGDIKKAVNPLIKDIRKNPLGALQGLLGGQQPAAPAPAQ